MYPETKLSTLEAAKEFSEELKEMAEEKIKESVEVRDGYSEAINIIYKKILKIKDEFSRTFWQEVLKVILPADYKHAVTEIVKWRRLKLMVNNTNYNNKSIKMEKGKEIAKETSILGLFPFEKLRKLGTRHQACCPFHQEKTPSFIIYPNNSFYCFGCNKGGDSIEFMKLLKECTFKEAIEQLAGRL